MASACAGGMAVRHLRYEVTNSGTPGTETSHYIDLFRDLSAINRQLIRQGQIAHVSRITVVSRNTGSSPGQDAGFVSASVIPDSWVTRNAWKYAFGLWTKMQNKAIEASPNNRKPRWNDFKIRALGAYASSPTFLTPLDNGGNSLLLGEWVYSRFVSPDGTTGADEYTIHMLGQHIGAPGAFSSVGLVESYKNNRATVATDSPFLVNASDDPLANLFDAGTTHDEVLEDMNTEGDAPPYDLDDYAGSTNNMPQPLVVAHNTLGTDGRCVLNGFAAMCGLIELEVTSPIASDVYSVLVELKAGSHKGLHCEAI